MKHQTQWITCVYPKYDPNQTFQVPNQTNKQSTKQMEFPY